jgi:hypothetical protein
MKIDNTRFGLIQPDRRGLYTPPLWKRLARSFATETRRLFGSAFGRLIFALAFIGGAAIAWAEFLMRGTGF